MLLFGVFLSLTLWLHLPCHWHTFDCQSNSIRVQNSYKKRIRSIINQLIIRWQDCYTVNLTYRRVKHERVKETMIEAHRPKLCKMFHCVSVSMEIARERESDPLPGYFTVLFSLIFRRIFCGLFLCLSTKNGFTQQKNGFMQHFSAWFFFFLFFPRAASSCVCSAVKCCEVSFEKFPHTKCIRIAATLREHTHTHSLSTNKLYKKCNGYDAREISFSRWKNVDVAFFQYLTTFFSILFRSFFCIRALRLCCKIVLCTFLSSRLNAKLKVSPKASKTILDKLPREKKRCENIIWHTVHREGISQRIHCINVQKSGKKWRRWRRKQSKIYIYVPGTWRR